MGINCNMALTIWISPRLSRTSNGKAFGGVFLRQKEQSLPVSWGAAGLLINTAFRGKLISIHGNLGGVLGLILAAPGQVRGWAVLGTGVDWGQQGLKCSGDVVWKETGTQREIRWRQDGRTEVCVGELGGGKENGDEDVLAWKVVVLAGKHRAAPPDQSFGKGHIL